MIRLPVLVFTMLLLASPALADYYRYTDAAGSVVITNDLKNVPARYRSKVKVITDDSLAKKDKGAAPAAGTPPAAPAPAHASTPAQPVPAQAAAESAPAPQPAETGFFARYWWAKPIVFVLGLVLVVILLMQLLAVLPPGPTGKVIVLVIFMGVGLFGAKLYADSLVNGYFSVKQKVMTMLKKSNQREAPAAGKVE